MRKGVDVIHRWYDHLHRTPQSRSASGVSRKVSQRTKSAPTLRPAALSRETQFKNHTVQRIKNVYKYLGISLTQYSLRS